MTFRLTLSHVLLSLRGRIHIRDGEGRPRYEARGEFALFWPTWQLLRGDRPVGRLRRRLLSWRTCYDARLDGEDFTFVRPLLSLRRRYTVQGGRWDGTVLEGNLWDLRLRIHRGGQLLAEAREHLLTLRETHQVDIHSDDPADERFVALCLVLVMREKADDNAARRRSRS